MADLHSKILDARPPPPGVQILSISCSFWEILAKSYVGAPPGELAPPPRGNPRSATDTDLNLTMHLKENAIILHSCEGVTSTEIKSADKLD